MSLPPLLSGDMNGDNVLPKSEDRLQLEADVINVLEGRVDIKTFDIEYQNKIKHFYQFAGKEINKYVSYIAPTIRSTMELI